MIELRLTDVEVQRSGGHVYLRGRSVVPGVGEDDVVAYFSDEAEEGRFESSFRGQVVIVRTESFEHVPGMGTMVRYIDSWRFEGSFPTKTVSPRTADAWKEIPHPEYHAVWDRFDDAFAFRPSVYPADWPTFREPTPSVTWDLEPVFESIGEYVWHAEGTGIYNVALLRALLQHTRPDERVLALDWQHTSYYFYPHRWSLDDPPTAWEIPSLPSGEYHIFVAEDFRFGSLGHPWEESLCIFGAEFLETYLSEAPSDLNRVMRRDGITIPFCSDPP